MAEGEEQRSSGAQGGAKDIRFDYIRDRVCSSLKVNEAIFEKLMAGDGRCDGAASRAFGGRFCRGNGHPSSWQRLVDAWPLHHPTALQGGDGAVHG